LGAGLLYEAVIDGDPGADLAHFGRSSQPGAPRITGGAKAARLAGERHLMLALAVRAAAFAKAADLTAKIEKKVAGN